MRRLSKSKNIVAILCWGPVESLSNGHFIRVYSLAEALAEKTNNKVVLIEYSEKPSKPYELTQPNISKNIIRVEVRGNESDSELIIKYVRFILYQVINIIKLFHFFSRARAVIVGGELFLPSIIILRILNTIRRNNIVRPLIIADPQMLLSEREQRKGRLLVAKLFMLVEKLFFTFSDMVIAISENMKRNINRILNHNRTRKRILVLPHTLPKKLRQSISCDRRIDVCYSIVMAFIGDLYIEHNLQSVTYLINAMKILDMKLLKDNIEKHIVLKIIGRVPHNIKKIIENSVSNVKWSKVSIEIVGFVENLDEYICNEVNVLLAPMFTMSGVSTKMLYYLRFKDKKIVASKEATEGLEHLLNNIRDRIWIAKDPHDFLLKLYDVVKGF